MSALIGALRATLSADTAQFEQGMKRAQRSASQTRSSIKRSLSGISGVVTAGLTGLAAGLSVGLFSQVIKGALDYAGSLGEVSQQLGVTTKELQTFRFAVQQNGGSVEQADAALGKLSLNMSKALAGSKASAAAFNAVGVSLDDIRNKSKSEIIGQIADQMVKTGGASRNAAAGVAIFGKGFQSIVPVLDKGSGGINELSEAARKLGIVLSDRQIQQADDTADKLDALKTVLSAQIAGTVAANANSILALSSSLASLTNSVVGFLSSNPMLALSILGAMAGSRFGLPGAAAGAFAGATAGAKLGGNKMPAPDLGLLKHNFIQAVRQKDYGRAKSLREKYLAAGGTIPGYNPTAAAVAMPQFLAGGGGASKTPRGRKDNSAEEAERQRLKDLADAHAYAQEALRADINVLQAKQSLEPMYDEQAVMQLRVLELQRQSEQMEIDYRLKAGEITEAQARELTLKNGQVAELEKQKVLIDRETERQERYEQVEQLRGDIKRQLKEAEAGLAETASERRAIELEILALAYEERRRRLNRIIQESKDADERHRAQLELNSLNAQASVDRQGVIAGTRGPMEDYMAGLPNTAAKWQEALEGVRVNGFMALEDSITSVITGTQSLSDAFSQMTQQILADLVRIMVQKAITFAIGSAFGGGGGFDQAGALATGSSALAGLSIPLSGFSTGGSFAVGDKHGRDRNLLALNGLPIARVSHGERVSVSDDNPAAPTAGGSFTFNNYARMSPEEARRTGMQAARSYQSQIAKASRNGIAG